MRFWLPLLNTIPQQMIILNGRFAQDMRSPSPRVFLSALQHSECSETRSYNKRTPFVCQHNLLFCSKGGPEIIGAAERYLNALPPVMDLILGRITPRSYCHKAKAAIQRALFTARGRGGPPRRRRDKATPEPAARGRADPGPWGGMFPALVPLQFGAGMQVGAPEHPARMRHV